MASFELKNYQDIKVGELITKCETQLDKAISSVETRRCLLEAPTGSGKTVMCGEFINRFTGPKSPHKIAFLWLAPNKLQEQSFQKLKKQLNGTAIKCITPDELKGAIHIKSNQVLFLNWSSINRNNNRLRMDNERSVYLDTIAKNTKKKYKIVSIIDEGHNTAEGTQTKRARGIIDSHLEIFVTATSGNLRNYCNDYVSVDPDDVVEEGMICESVRFNSSEESQNASSMEPEDVIAFGLKERERLVKLFQEEKLRGKKQVNPLMLIQLKDKKAEEDDDARNNVEKILAKHGITYQNGKLAVYLSDDHKSEQQTTSIKRIQKRNKINLEGIDENDSKVEVLIFKQAIALGWDCPRASILCLFRDLKNETFGIQVIGRLMRMPDQKHYDKHIDLNHAYVIANFDKIKLADDIKNLVEQDYLKRKPALWKGNEISLPRYYKKTKSNRTNLTASKFTPIFLDKDIQKQFKTLHQYPVDKLKKHKEKVLQNLNLSAEQITRLTDSITGPTKSMSPTEAQLIQEYNKRLIGLTSGFSVQDSKGAVEEALYRSFGEKPFEFGIFDNTNPEDDEKIRKYVTSPDTDQIIEECVHEAKKIYAKEYSSKKQQTIEIGKDWEIPKIVPHNPNASLSSEKKYLLDKLDKTRLTNPEEKFAKKLSSSGKVKWWYKNRDSGRDNFAVPYKESDGTIREFFVDFIVKFLDGKIGLFDTKSGQTLESDETKAKAEGLAYYIKKINKNRKKNELLIGGIVANIQPDTWTGKFKYNPDGNKPFEQTKVDSKWTDVPL